MAVPAPSTQPAEPREVEGNGAVPPLENGDRLTRAEFERRYEAMPERQEGRADRRRGLHALARPIRPAQPPAYPAG